jgi:hypothetical protein
MDLHEGSILSSRTTDSLATASGWREICQELRDLGISASALQENRDFIKRTLSVAIENNGIVSDGEGDELDVDEDRLRRESTATLVEEEYVQRQGRLAKRHSKAAVVVNPDLRELSEVTDHVDSKKYSRAVGKMLRLFRLASDERLIEAADEDDMRTILKLIGRGANVRVTDKWRWTALHMSAYGGYEDISRLLIEHGAELDVRTVDGETPLKLAERNGHAKVVQLIEEEVERRRVRELEAQGLDRRMEILETKATDDEFGEFAGVEGKSLWRTNTLVAAHIEEVELAPDEIAK